MRGLAMVGALALDQRDGACQSRALAGANAAGEFGIWLGARSHRVALAPTLGRTFRLLRAVGQPDCEAAFVLLPRRGGARKREQLLARLDAAGRPAIMLAIGGAGGLIGVRLVPRQHQVDALWPP